MKPSVIPFKPSRKKIDILDQTRLPGKTHWVECKTARDVSRSITKMHVRGAPAIGVTAAYGFYLEIYSLLKNGKKITKSTGKDTKHFLDSSRPTAVNLSWATSRMLHEMENFFSENSILPENITDNNKIQNQFLTKIWKTAEEIHLDDAARCLAMGSNTADLIIKTIPKEKLNILTHCNTGSLATGGIGTALGAIRVLHNRNKINRVYADETRPFNQGARLTAYELVKEKIPATLVVDSMAAYLMQKGMIDAVIVGSDRITRRGDVANKIGTYMLSVAAKAHNIPFYVVAPLSTYDDSIEFGKEIPIEKRDEKEVTHIGGKQIAAEIPVLNYSFDVTPYENITSIVTEKGIFEPSGS